MQTKKMRDMNPEERSQYMREIRQKVKNPGGKANFAHLSKDKQREIARKGGLSRWNNTEENDGLEQGQD